jgi:hypothetical protein
MKKILERMKLTEKLKLDEQGREKSLHRLLRKKFPDKIVAIRYAKKHIADFKERENPGDEHFEIKSEPDEEATSLLTDALIQMVKQAKRDGAAIVIPDYTTRSAGGKLIQLALEEADFTGPVVNVCNHRLLAFDAATYASPAAGVSQRGVLLKRATHSFEAKGQQGAPYSRIAARIAKAIAGGYGLDEAGGAAQDADQAIARFKGVRSVVAMVAGGDAEALQHVAELVKEEVPLIVVEGSGRLCNFLPRAFLQRFSSGFSAYDASRRLCRDCGFPREDSDLLGRSIRTILQERPERFALRVVKLQRSDVKLVGLPCRTATSRSIS